MLDCGKSPSRPWSPSLAHWGERIDTFLIQNLDEDHVEDLDGLWTWATIGAFVSNPTVSADALLAMKPYGMRSGVRKAHEILRAQGPLIANWRQSLGGVQWQSFYNRFQLDFEDTNNLSLATFVTNGPFTILFGGDLETAGWKKLMGNTDFLLRLLSVDVFVASHHGRENGICEDLFRWCKPKLVVFSDGPKQHETQETASWYATKAEGIPDWSQPTGLFGLQPLRKVMTTRKDGTIRIDVQANGNWVAHRNPRPMAPSGLLASVLASAWPS